jgi:hypothetical protein
MNPEGQSVFLDPPERITEVIKSISGAKEVPWRLPMPLLSCVAFEWIVASKGYTIVENKEANCQLVVPLKGPSRVTQPLQQYPVLFKQFAKLEPTAAAVVSFANRFGLLQSDPNQNGLAHWFASSRDFAELTNGTSATWSEGEVSSLTRLDEILRTGVITEITKVGLVLRPISLLAAMALQFGFWLQDSDDRIGQCAECGNTWLIGPRTGHRGSRKYCSPNCRDAARYRRKKSNVAMAT